MSVQYIWTVRTTRPAFSLQDTIPLELGPRLRAAREARKISVRSLAQRTGFSPSFLSQVELGQSSPSLASLQRICDALELDLPDLLKAETKRASPIVRRAEREAVRSEWSKASAASLLPDGSDERFGALLLSIDPGGRTGAWPTRHGTKEMAYCVRGRVHLRLDEAEYELSSGDSAVIDSANASWENRGGARAEIIIVSARLT